MNKYWFPLLTTAFLLVIGCDRKASSGGPDGKIMANVHQFEKPTPTGFFGSLLLSPNKHGADTALMVYHWVKDGTEPPKETYIKSATLINRDNWKAELQKQGML